MNVRRRSLLIGSAAVAATSALAGASARASSKAATGAKASRKATYVLVHGGGHGGWCWQRVAAPLREQGHAVYAPSMTGMADRSHLLNPDINLDTQITDIVNLLRWEGLNNVILVGHSYGGMVITGVADRAHDRIGQLVYLDAAHPKNGDPLWRMSGAEGSAAGGAGSNGNPMLRMARVVNGVELILFPDAAFINGPLGVTKPEDVAWLMEKLTPHPLKCFTQPLRMDNEAAVKKIPTTDIWRSMILKSLDPDGSRRKTMADRVWEINSPAHDLMVTDPKPVTEMLLKLAAL
jgi:pimeloyl-ACP methyl ester carboxylesterase